MRKWETAGLSMVRNHCNAATCVSNGISEVKAGHKAKSMMALSVT